MGVFEADGTDAAGHEQVVFCQDRPTGLKAIIAIYSTALGPALGGTRFYPYASRGGRADRRAAPVPGDGVQERAGRAGPGRRQGGHLGRPGANSRARRCCGRTGGSSQSLDGRYYTACDVGTYVADMDVVARETRFVTGRSVEHGGAGDSSILTAWGVFQGMRAAAEHTLGQPDAGRSPGRRSPGWARSANTWPVT